MTLAPDRRPTALAWLRQRCGDLEGGTRKLRLQKERLELRVLGMQSESVGLVAQVDRLKAEVASLRSEVHSRDERLSKIYESRTWRLAEHLWRTRGLLDVVETLAEAFILIVRGIMRTAPVGVFCLITPIVKRAVKEREEFYASLKG